MSHETTTYRRRIRAWAFYDWANSAFATTVLSAVLPVYYGKVAGATLPSGAVATSYWTTGLSVSLLIVAVLSPILGTLSDVVRGKKRFLSIAAGVGILATGLLVFVGRGDWMLASILFVVGRVGFASANVFYDALLPHVAKEEDQDRVSTLGYAAGYLGGGLLLALNIVMIKVMPDTWGYRYSFLSVAVWWALFSIPLLRIVPEPPSAAKPLAPGRSVLVEGFARLADTFRHLRRYRELAKFLLAFLIYNDGIGTIIGVAAIYMAELRFEPAQIILAMLLVQFVGIPYSVVFGRIASPGRGRAFLLAFVVVNLIALPVVGVFGARLLPADLTGRAAGSYEASATAVGEGEYALGVDGADEADPALQAPGWTVVAPADLGRGAAGPYARSAEAGAALSLRYVGREVEVVYAESPGGGRLAVLLDGAPLLEDGLPVLLDLDGPATRYEVTRILDAGADGEHDLALVVEAPGDGALVRSLTVLKPRRVSQLGSILLLLLGVQGVAALLAFVFGRPLFGRLATAMDAKRTIFVALGAYAIIAVWGYVLDSVIEFWFLAWMVAVVQGGSQALSRSLYARMSPKAMSGEFFGFFTIMSKFSAILGPLLFMAAIVIFDSSRPAILSITVFFVLGGYLLSRVDVEAGHAAAQQADREAAASS